MTDNENKNNPQDDIESNSEPSQDTNHVMVNFSNGDTYHGEIKNSKKEGKGQYTFSNEDEYEKAASDVVNNPKSLHKKEKEDNDDVYYLEKSNEFVIVSTDGYIRTYFKPDAGKSYYDRQ